MSSPVIALPRFIMLKANNHDKFLRVVGGGDQAGPEAATAAGHVQFTADTGVDPDAKFEVEASREPGNGGLVHIRSCYNNKYLARASQDSTWIKAWSPDKDEADKTHWACTLFEPIRARNDDSNGRSFIRLRHVQLGSFVSLTRTSSPIEFDWGVAATDTNVEDVFRVTDWESVVIFPKIIALKGSNGNYLVPGNPVWLNEITLLCNGNDIGNAALPVEVIPHDDGSTIRIINRSNGMRWKTYSRTISGGVPGLMSIVMSPDNAPIANFWPIRVTNDGNVIALHMNIVFCRLDHSTLMLNCNSASITADTRLQVVEPVIRRNVSVNFRFEDARIYDVEPIALATHTAENNLVDVPYVARVGLSESYTDTRSWENSVSLTVGVETTFRSGIPLIAAAGITMTTEINDTFTFGKSHEITNVASAEVEVTVPPMSKVTASLMATKGRCNVPFSYIQTDVYYDGRTVSHTLYDGVYNGVNHYGFYSRVDPAVRNSSATDQ